jgi:hypothetical protein
MAKPRATTIFEIGDAHIRAGWGGRAASLATRREDGVLVVEMDSADTWEDGGEISLPDLTRLYDLLERECGERGIEAEFE